MLLDWLRRRAAGMAAPALGVRVGGYRLVRLLGEGGMGMVFEAVHEGVGGRAAIKVLRPEAAARHDITARFFNEARAANAVEHPSIIRIFDSGFTKEGLAYLAMEFLSGETLTRRMERVGRLQVAQSVLIARQVASALGAVHAREVVHRDLKPDNLMLVSDPEAPNGERIKLLDFGIARLTEELRKSGIQTLSGMLMGTPAYMSPEQCRGAKSVSTRSDVYSLGVMLYQMLAGRPPFLSEGVGDLLAMHIKDPPPPLRQFVEVTPELAHLVHSMLAKAPDERPTMDAVAKALRGMSRSLEPVAPPRAEGAPAAAPPMPAETVEPPSAERGDPVRAAAQPASAAPTPSVVELAPAELEEVGADEAQRPGSSLHRAAQAATREAPRIDLSQLPTLHPGVRAPSSSQPSVERPPGAPRVPTLRSFAGETFGAASTVRRVGVSLALLTILSGAGALSYSLLRARPPAVRPAASEVPRPPAEPPRSDPPPSRPAPPSKEPEAVGAAAVVRPAAEPAPATAKPAPPAAAVKSVDPHLAAARQSLANRRYEEAFSESGRCAADWQLQCAALQARAACRTNRRVLVQELQGRIAVSKLPQKERERLQQEIAAECEADSLDHAEKFLAAKNFQSAQLLARSLGRVYPVRANEIAGRAACALRDRPGALDALNKLRTTKPQYESLVAYCKGEGLALP
ncbi:MAG: serine/threonine-protein kinase [Polyangia bacterium]